MTPDQMRAVAAKLREDNPEVNAAMTANGRAAAVTIYALADAIEKVAEEEVVDHRSLVAYDDFHTRYRCKLCGIIITDTELTQAENAHRLGVLGRHLVNVEDVTRHFGKNHPRQLDAVSKEINA